MRILHLEDDPADSLLIERGLEKHGVSASFAQARTREEFVRELQCGRFDLALVDGVLPGFSGLDAIRLAHTMQPDLPVIVCSGAGRDSDVEACLAAGARDYVLKDSLWQVAASLRRVAAVRPTQPVQPVDSALLVEVVQQLSLARTLPHIVDIVRRAARQLAGSDGATFVLRDGPNCYYVDEDAISPLWKGQRFPLEACISGWAMLNRRAAVIPDIRVDPRIPQAAYEPTFVRSLVMVPIRASAPIGAIGNYWATHHECTAQELSLLEALANTTAVAMENVTIYQSLEQQVRDRTLELQLSNQELEAFTSAVAHDLRAPLRAMNAQLAEALEAGQSLDASGVAQLSDMSHRMGEIIEDLLRLSRVTRLELRPSNISMSELAARIVEALRAANPERHAEVQIEPGMYAKADPGLLTIALENLFSNAWKYSAKRELTRIEFGRAAEKTSGCVYRIQDNGAGFDPAYAQKLFKPFTRLHDSRDFPGTGIGLATVQRILRRHGGDITARSDGRSGAVFEFTLGLDGTSS